MQKNGIEMDDVVNFALLFSQKFMIARMKKDILDKKWTAKRVATVIEKIAGIECVNMNSDRVRFEACPICWHEDFMVFVNNDEIPTFGYCLKCGAHNIWEILNETGTGNFVDVIHEVWEIFEEKEATAKAKNEHKQKAIQQKQQQEQQKQKQQYKTRTELEEERRRIIEENFEEPYMTPEEEYRQAQEIIQYLLKKAAERKAKTTTKAAV